ncbi:MAG: rod shape-determining protein MreD [Chitinophagaceae bacterium]|nr:rod shape-determining protein MreD [Chitinophagaceae bacterium]
MLSRIIGYFIRFALLAFAQVMILNNVHLHGLFNPYIYPLFILLLPFETPPSLVLIIGFLCGIVIDLYSNSLGLHAAATTVVAFLRPYMINLLRPAAGYQPEDRPTIASMGFLWFMVYASVLVFMHHLVFFMIETLSFSQFLFVISKIAVSTAISVH